ncbi:enoyl-CoA hydratase/isomerase family protein [Halorarum salinum]|uniref:Enoyl-CoA hydratase/isomerase family protein n=1 Tax=Halorarum salinum TaxID=2743089 RepID=A0A7D5QD76_9EURY|nr:enoyl-CoA hydratase-related protein [Halobaculum salinum]QLG63918.1 enoyl-CoA hydratase/isomerase family protein [Halobaculum salinum]
MSGSPVDLDVSDGVATVTLDRPETRNAMSPAVADGLRERMDAVSGREDVRCVVVTGAGGAFCAGGDVERMRERVDSDVPVGEHVEELRSSIGAGVASVATCELPTVAAIDGPAAGAGATLAIACDLQVATESSVVGFTFRQVGLTVDSGASHLLPRLVGTNTAKRLVLSGELIGAEEAADLGLFTHVVDDDRFEAELESVVRPLAEGPTVALRHAKRLVEEGASTSYERALTNEAVAQGVVYDTRDHAEGVEAFLDGRDPDFEGR